MDLQSHQSGQIPGQIQNQAVVMLSQLSQQNGNPVPNQIQNNSNSRHLSPVDPEIVKGRRFILSRILGFLRKNWKNQEPQNNKMMYLGKRLEAALFQSARTKDDYLNLGTLESRLLILIKRIPRNNHNQLFTCPNSSLPVSKMIPTPGFQQTGNSCSTLNSSLVPINSSNAFVPPTVSSGCFLPARFDYSGSLNGALASGYQQSSPAFSVDCGGNIQVASMGVQKMTSRMIPTPGTNVHNDNNTSNNTWMNTEKSNSGGACPAESTGESHNMLPKHIDQNIGILHDIGGHEGGDTRSKLQQKSFNGLISRRTDEELLEATLYGNSAVPTPLHPHYDQHARSVMMDDAHGNGVSDVSGSRNLHVTVSSGGPMINKQSLNPMPAHLIEKTDPLVASNQSNVYCIKQGTDMKLPPTDQPEKGNPQYPARENTSQCSQHHEQQFQQPFRECQSGHYQGGQNKQMPNPNLLKRDTSRQSELLSDVISESKSLLAVKGRQPNISQTIQFADLQNQYQQNSIKGHSGATQHASSSQAVLLSSTQASDQMQQLLLPQQVVANAKSCFTDLSGGTESDRVSHGQQPRASGLPSEQNVQDDQHRYDALRPAEPQHRSNNLTREQKIKGQQKWLIMLKHGRRCSGCQNCIRIQNLCKHIEHCNELSCEFPRCRSARDLMNHHTKCHDKRCLVCIPIKKFEQAQRARPQSLSNSELPNPLNLSCNSHDPAEIVQKSTPILDQVVLGAPEELHPVTKRMRTEQGPKSLVYESDSSVASTPNVLDCHIQNTMESKQHCNHTPIKSEINDVKLELCGSSEQLSPWSTEMSKDMDVAGVQTPEGKTVASKSFIGLSAEEALKTEQPRLQSASVVTQTASNSGKSKIIGVSMIEFFTREQVSQHITSLRQWIGKSKSKAVKNQAMEHLMGKNTCQLCRVEKLCFEPPPIYCTGCGVRVKRNAMYYNFGSGKTRQCFCIPCYNEARGDTIVVDGTSISKKKALKKKNNEETDEGWVQCDKCEAWQHQVCALFNSRRDDGHAEYTCPNCYIAKLDRGECVPLLESTILGAKDLPRTNLSDHLEERLFAKLKQERQDRARLQGKSYDEVPGAESLVVRVVSSVDKKLGVKPRFLKIFRDQNYPLEFSYKSKAILLFQRIEGVEVFLFGMYVQEFGSGCPQPNNRRVYLSYLDSVKYFRPEVKTVTGEALRTFVYHEILIGYLDYCKKRGFTSCYIWACPPLKGEDYILYCHPEIQKTPKSDKLREWYLGMLHKAAKENIVVDITNLYKHFFVSNGECRAKVTAARLPYFDGDYWPGAAEDIIYQMQLTHEGDKQQQKGAMKKSSMRRALKASGETDLSGYVSKDQMLMHKLGEMISPMKDDFIMVHLQHACSHCCILMVSGNRWVCGECTNFQLCDMCHDAEKIRENRERHPINQKDKHALHPVEISEVPDDTGDDESFESEFFDTRQAFLSLCQGNHYQYDTLRRAKHSSMMILYHLHNPTAPAFVSQCDICHLEIDAGQGWRCQTCPDYDICNACYTNGGVNHPHKLSNHLSNDHDAQNKEARKRRVEQRQQMNALLVHASQCRSPNCQFLNCRKVKLVFRHGMACKTRAVGGCITCKKMWHLLQIHAQTCGESECCVPRCEDLKNHMRRVQQQSESRRRAGVMEMMRQRRSEVGSSS